MHRVRKIRILLALTLTGVVLPVLPDAAFPQSPPRPGRRVLTRELDADLRLAVKRGFKYLISPQRRGRSFSPRFPVAVNALVGMAFLSAGYDGRVGPYTLQFGKCVESLLGFQQSNGYISDGRSRMYGHGFATLFLAELYGMSGDADKRIRAALTKAVRLIEKSQSPDGGWDYEPEASGGDTSITVCQTMALRAARNLGIAVNHSVISKAKEFVLSAQNPRDGGFYYRLEFRAKVFRSAFPRSAAGVCVLLSLGDYNSEPVKKGFGFLMRKYTSRNVFPYYADYYCTQAMFHAGRHYWRDYFRHVRDKLLRKQLANGSWEGGYGGTEQSTAMALIVLQMPYQYLPITER